MSRHILLLVIAYGLSLSSIGQNTEDLLGKGFNSKEVAKFTKPFSESNESFLPYLRTYKLDYPSNGISMEFNTDLALYRMVFYDSGHSYSQFKSELPFKLQWKMSLKQIEDKIGMLEEVSDNPFKKLYTKDEYITEFYFVDNRLNLIKITATDNTLKTTAKSVFSGWGFRLLPDGKALEGDVISGTGTMAWGNNAAIYKGEWSYGLPHGEGEYVDSFGNKYSGMFKLGFFWGEGDFYSKQDASSYSGNYVMGKKHGKGKVSYKSMVGYQGDWFQDKMEGYGTYVMGSKYYYVGNMRNNNFNGKGELNTPDGTITGKFRNGKPHGYCVQETSDGFQRLEGVWQNGIKQGEFKLTVNAITKTQYFENDIEIIKPEN